MDLTSSEYLQHLQRYAQKYFPEPYDKLPCVDDLHCQRHSEKPTKTQQNYEISSHKLYVGSRSGQDPKWAYWSLALNDQLSRSLQAVSFSTH
jgi:hypothetical protein